MSDNRRYYESRNDEDYIALIVNHRYDEDSTRNQNCIIDSGATSRIIRILLGAVSKLSFNLHFDWLIGTSSLA